MTMLDKIEKLYSLKLTLLEGIERLIKEFEESEIKYSTGIYKDFVRLIRADIIALEDILGTKGEINGVERV